MICPHCKYEHGWSGELLKGVTGDEGDFYKLPITLERDGIYHGDERVGLYGCPNCKKTFIGR